MRYSYIFTDEINNESVAAFSSWLNNVPHEAQVCVYLGSPGGMVDSTEVFYDLLLSIGQNRLMLQASGAVMSAALFVFIRYTGFKSMRFGTVGMAHLIYEDAVHLLSDGRPKNAQGRVMMAEFPAWQKLYDDVLLPHLTPEQVVQYKAAEDVWLSSAQMWEITLKTRLPE